MVNLLGCPFCGGNPTLINGGPGNCYVRCTECKASSNDVSRDRVSELWNTRALSTPNAPVEQREAIGALQGRAIFPIKASRKSYFINDFQNQSIAEMSKRPDREQWAALIEQAVNSLAVRLDEAAIRKDEREKAIHEADQFVGALWSDLFNKDMVKAAGAYFFDKWRAQIRAIAIRNGGKRP